MGHHRSRFAVVLALLLGALPALADQGFPVYTSANPQPTLGGACSPVGRLWLDISGNIMRPLCCGAAGTWTECGTNSSGTNGTLQIADGAGGFSAYAGGSCSNKFFSAFSSQGLGTCTAVSDPYVTDIGAGKLTFADSTTYTFGKTTPTGVVLNLGHNGTAALANTFNIGAHTHTATGGTGGQIAYSSLTGAPTLAPTTVDYIVGAANATLTAERVATDTATVDVDIGTSGQAKWNVLYAPELTCTGCAAIGNEVASTVSLADMVLRYGTAATSGATTQDSRRLQFTSSYWNGTAAADRTFSIFARQFGANATDVQLEITLPAAGTGLVLTDDGDLSVSGAVTASIAKDGTALETCAIALSGMVRIKRNTGVPDEVHMCLRNSDATWGWAMIGLAVK